MGRLRRPRRGASVFGRGRKRGGGGRDDERGRERERERDFCLFPFSFFCSTLVIMINALLLSRSLSLSLFSLRASDKREEALLQQKKTSRMHCFITFFSSTKNFRLRPSSCGAGELRHRLQRAQQQPIHRSRLRSSPGPTPTPERGTL